jgi:hypothetical protein
MAMFLSSRPCVPQPTGKQIVFINMPPFFKHIQWSITGGKKSSLL